MKNRVLLLVIATVVLMASCKKEKTTDPQSQTDLYKSFLADATPRWEKGTIVEMIEGSIYTYIIDKGGNLFSSANYKVGRMWNDGDNYEFIEFSAPPAVGKPSSAVIRRHTSVNTVPLNRLEILKIEGGKLWIVFQETATSEERRIVQ